MTDAARQVCDVLGGTARLQITIPIGKAHHRIGVADIDPLRLGPRRIEAMPNGRFKPVANVADCFGLPSAVIPRNTRISPSLLSATKKSPFGAVRISRG